MKNILVSIITVTYNSEKTIERTIKSVLNQTYDNIEYIIIDGKSTDSTINIVKKYKDKFKGRLNIISEPDNGIYDAMNKGIRLASGKLIGIINSDDYYEIDAVENMVKNMNNKKYQILYGYMRIFRNGINTETILWNHENLENAMIAHPTCFITKDLYDDFGMYNTEYKSCSDYEFMIKQFRNEKVDFICVNKVIANFTAGIGMSSNLNSHLECLKMRKKYNLISNKDYWKQMLKIKIKRIIRI